MAESKIEETRSTAHLPLPNKLPPQAAYVDKPQLCNTPPLSSVACDANGERANDYIQHKNTETTPMATHRDAEGNEINESIRKNKAQGENVWRLIDRRSGGQRKRTARKLRQVLRLEDIFQNEETYFERYYIIKLLRMNINTELDIIKTDDDLKRQVGQLKKITKAGKDTLLIESSTSAQSTKIRGVTKLAGTAVVVTPHKRYNTVKGVVRSKAFGKSTEEDLKERLEEQGVTEVKRDTIKREGQIVQTDTYILTFNKHAIPRVVNLSDWHHELVEDYKYRPQQCFHCQRYGHVAKYCRQEDAVCARCSMQGHKRNECTNPIKCYNCGHPHFANDKNCRKYCCEEMILNKQMKERIPRPAAMNEIFDEHPEYEELYAVKNNDSAGNNITIGEDNDGGERSQHKMQETTQRTENPEATTSGSDTIDRKDNRHLTTMQARTQNREKRTATNNQYHDHHRDGHRKLTYSATVAERKELKGTVLNTNTEVIPANEGPAQAETSVKKYGKDKTMSKTMPEQKAESTIEEMDSQSDLSKRKRGKSKSPDKVDTQKKSKPEPEKGSNLVKNVQYTNIPVIGIRNSQTRSSTGLTDRGRDPRKDSHKSHR